MKLGVSFSLFLLFLSLVLGSYDVRLDTRMNPVVHVAPKATNRWTVELEEGIDADEIAQRHGLVNKGQVKFSVARHHYIFEGEGELQHLHTAPGVRMHENHLYRMRHKRLIPAEAEEVEDEERLVNSLLRVLNREANEEHRFKRKARRDNIKKKLLQAVRVLDSENPNHKKVVYYLKSILEEKKIDKKGFGSLLTSNLDEGNDEGEGKTSGNYTYEDPLFALQWHLHNNSHADINVLPVWDSGITGKGVQIAIVDDGLDTNHPDLKANYDSESSTDFNGHKRSPDPDPRDEYNSHGTSAAGVAAAARNSVCGIGVAYNSRLAAIRMVAAPVSDHEEAEGLVYSLERNHIYSSSWGPTDDGQRMEAPSRLTKLAIKEGVTKGRNGLGAIYVWAAGNGGLRGDNCNYDGFANNRFALAIGSITNSGQHAAYSEHCAALDAVTPSSGGAKGIVTTALQGLSGGGCTSSFGGTSASSPMAAGVVALVLEANSKLTWRDVQGIVHLSSRKVDETDADWKQNGAGLWVNHKYGFGLMDATAAVTLAKTWTNYPVELPPLESGPQPPVSTNSSQELSYEVTGDITVLHVEVNLDATINARGHAQIVLFSPSGLDSVIHDYHEDQGSNVIAWTYTSKRYWHENSKGTWKLRISTRNSMPITVNSWGLKLYGHNH